MRDFFYSVGLFAGGKGNFGKKRHYAFFTFDYFPKGRSRVPGYFYPFGNGVRRAVYKLGSIFACGCAFACEVPYFVRHDREALAGLAGACGFYRRV